MKFCVFLVNQGEMFYFNLDITGIRVDKFRNEIRRKTQIPIEGQILLVSGGSVMLDTELVGTYNAGTESNPVFLFDLGSLTANRTPMYTSKYPVESYDMILKVYNLPPSLATLQKRCTVAQEIYEASEKYTNLTRELIQDHHLQHQGWCSALANLDDALEDVKVDAKNFQEFLVKFRRQRESSLITLKQLDESMEMLKIIPFFKSVYEKSPSVIKDEFKDNMVLYDIVCSIEKSNLSEEANYLRYRLNKLDIDVELSHVDNMLRELIETSSNESMRTVGGLEAWFQKLEDFLGRSVKSLEKQDVYTQSFKANYSRCREIADPQLLPDLCASHRQQLEVMQKECDEIIKICRRCQEAKSDFSKNLLCRLRWVIIQEKKITDITSTISTLKEHVTKLTPRMLKIEQINSTPKVYIQLCSESCRRHQYVAQQFGDLTLNQVRLGRKQEVSHRRSFYASIAPHFLLAFFPGLERLPPACITKFECKEELPLLTQTDLKQIQQVLPTDSKLHDLPNTGVDDSGIIYTPPPSHYETDRDGSTKKRSIHQKTSTAHKANKVTRVDADVLNPGSGGILLEGSDQESDVETADEFVDAAGDSEFLSSFEPVSHKHYIEAERQALEERYSAIIKKLEDDIIQLQEQIQNSEAALIESRREHDTLVEKITSEHQLKLTDMGEKLNKQQAMEDEEKMKLKQRVMELESMVSELSSQMLFQKTEHEENYKSTEHDLHKKIQSLEADLKAALELPSEEVCEKYRLAGEQRVQKLHDAEIKKLKNQLNELRLQDKEELTNHHSEELQQLQTQIKQKDSLLDKHLSAYTELMAKNEELINRHSEEVLELQTQIQQKDSLIEKDQCAYTELTAKNDELTNRLAEELQELQTQIQQKDDLIEKDQSGYTELTGENDKLRQKLNALEGHLKEKGTRLEELESQLEEAAALQIKYNRLNSEKEKCDVKNSTLTRDKELLQKTLEEMRCVDSDFYKRIQSEIKSKSEQEHTYNLQQQAAEYENKIKDLEVEHENRSQEMKKSLQVVHESKYKSQLKSLTHKNESLRKELDSLQSSTSRSEQSLASSTIVLNRSGSDLTESVSQPNEQVKILEQQIQELKEQLSISVPLNLLDDRLTFSSIKVGDHVILRFDEKHLNYVILSTSTSKYFLHAECLVDLGLSILDGQPHPTCIAEITDKEYCEAKKPNNRFRVQVGVRFYRVKAKPSSLNRSHITAQRPIPDTNSS